MITPQLLSYIKIQLQKNITVEEIKKTLLASGWQLTDVDEAFLQAGAVSAPVPGSIPSMPNKTFSSPLMVERLTEESPKGVSRKLLVALILAILIFLLGVGGAFAYFRYFASPVLTPDLVLQKMAANLPNIKSFEYTGEIKAEADASKYSNASTTMAPSALAILNKKNDLSIKFSGVSDFQDVSKPKGSLSLTLSTNSFASGTVTTLGFEIRTIDQIIYAKLTEAPNFGFITLDPLKNQWVKIDLAEVKQQLQSKIGNLSSSTTIAVSTANKTNLTEDQINQIKQAIWQSKIVKVIAQLPDEQINGANTYHYQIALDREEIKKLILTITPIVQSRAPSADELKQFDQALASTEFPNGEIWVGQTDFYPYKLLLTPKVKSADGSTEVGQASIILMFNNFNQPAAVDIPSPVKTVQEIMSEFLKSSTPSVK
ncbi:MAG: hypothetical protein WC640_03005 [Candidatus Paceibacterota bacterium]